MTRFLAQLILGAAVLIALWAGTVRTERHPLLIDARSSWCEIPQGGPLTVQPPKYDYQLRKRRIENQS